MVEVAVVLEELERREHHNPMVVSGVNTQSAEVLFSTLVVAVVAQSKLAELVEMAAAEMVLQTMVRRLLELQTEVAVVVVAETTQELLVVQVL
jgi:hypothetical protein